MAKSMATRAGGSRLAVGKDGPPTVVPLTSRSTQSSSASNAQLLNAAESLSSMGHWHVDSITNEVTWSDALYAVFGLDPLEFKPRADSLIAFCHKEDREHVAAIFNAAFNNGEGFEVDFRITRPDGKVRTVI